MTAPLIRLAPPQKREAGLSLAVRLTGEGIGAVLVPEPARPGEFSLSVPRSEEREARKLLEQWRRGPALGPYRDSAPDDEEEEVPSRLRRLAVFFGLGFGFGFGHLYAREGTASCILGLGQLGCFLLAAGGLRSALWAFPALVLLDAVGAIFAVDRENAASRREPVVQLAMTLPPVALVLATTVLWMTPS